MQLSKSGFDDERFGTNPLPFPSYFVSHLPSWRSRLSARQAIKPVLFIIVRISKCRVIDSPLRPKDNSIRLRNYECFVWKIG
jgi:hypothetical protein